MCALIALTLTVSAQAPPARATGDQRRQYVFAPTGQQMPYRVYVPKTWDGKVSLPIILMLHGAGANESTYLDQADGLLMKLAEQHGYIVVSPLGFTPLGAYGNPLRLPAVFGQTAAAASQRAAVTPARQRELNLSELEVMTALEIVTEEYGADRSRTYLAGHSMGSGGAWHLAARYPERWRAVAPMSGPFVDEATYPFDRIRRLPIFMTEGTGATPSLEGSRVLARYMRERGFAFEYLEVDGNHGSMVPMVWPRIFEFFNRQGRGRLMSIAERRSSGAGRAGATGDSPLARQSSGLGAMDRSRGHDDLTDGRPDDHQRQRSDGDGLPSSRGSATGTAVVVAPGGALRLLGWDNEGVKVAQWLNSKGIAALVLKYRTLQTMPASGRGAVRRRRVSPVAGGAPRKELEIRNGNANPEPDDPALREVLHMGIADAQQALRLARQNAAAWRIDPARVGIMGFSAGGGIAVGTSLAERSDASPDFLVSLYGPSLQDVNVPAHAPPLFIAVGSSHFNVTNGCLALFAAWKAAGKPAEIHVYDQVSAGFGMTKRGLPVDSWNDRLLEWLTARKLR